MKKFFVFAAVLVFNFVGCTHHTIKIEQEQPLRVDVNMRIDVYNHVMEHADEIEKMVNEGGKQSCSFWRRLVFLLDFATPVYAQAGSEISQKFGKETLDAINNRKLRRNEILKWESQGTVGENINGYVQFYSRLDLTKEQIEKIEKLIKDENADRQVIYQNIAQIENITTESVGRIYAEKIQKNAPSGTPVQIIDEKQKSEEWIIK